MSENDFKNYEAGVPDNFEIPAAGIENIDRSVFDLFDKDIGFQIETNGKIQKVPVVFAAGERFALTRRKNPIRDNNNALILPLISIDRTSIDFSPNQGNRKSAIATRDQFNYVIKKRLASEDREYQNIKNKSSLKNQNNVASRGHFALNTISPGDVAISLGENSTIASRRQGTPISFSGGGGLIGIDSKSSLGDNIFEVIQVPYPIFIAITYKATLWAQYMQQMNQLQEIYLTKMKGQASEFVLKTSEGYEYVAKSSEVFASDTNFSDYTESERVIKTSIDIVVPGYIINPKHPGIPNQLRSFYSAPQIEFGYHTVNSQVFTKKENSKNDPDKFILSDLETIEEIENRPERGQTDALIAETIENPFSGESKVQFSRIINRNNRSGETVASSLIVKKIETQHD